MTGHNPNLPNHQPVFKPSTTYCKTNIKIIFGKSAIGFDGFPSHGFFLHRPCHRRCLCHRERAQGKPGGDFEPQNNQNGVLHGAFLQCEALVR